MNSINLSHVVERQIELSEKILYWLSETSEGRHSLLELRKTNRMAKKWVDDWIVKLLKSPLPARIKVENAPDQDLHAMNDKYINALKKLLHYPMPIFAKPFFIMDFVFPLPVISEEAMTLWGKCLNDLKPTVSSLVLQQLDIPLSYTEHAFFTCSKIEVLQIGRITVNWERYYEGNPQIFLPQLLGSVRSLSLHETEHDVILDGLFGWLMQNENLKELQICITDRRELNLIMKLMRRKQQQSDFKLTLQLTFLLSVPNIEWNGSNLSRCILKSRFILELYGLKQENFEWLVFGLSVQETNSMMAKIVTLDQWLTKNPLIPLCQFKNLVHIGQLIMELRSNVEPLPISLNSLNIRISIDIPFHVPIFPPALNILEIGFVEATCESMYLANIVQGLQDNCPIIQHLAICVRVVDVNSRYHVTTPLKNLKTLRILCHDNHPKTRRCLMLDILKTHEVPGLEKLEISGVTADELEYPNLIEDESLTMQIILEGPSETTLKIFEVYYDDNAARFQRTAEPIYLPLYNKARANFLSSSSSAIEFPKRYGSYCPTRPQLSRAPNEYIAG